MEANGLISLQVHHLTIRKFISILIARIDFFKIPCTLYENVTVEMVIHGIGHGQICHVKIDTYFYWLNIKHYTICHIPFRNLPIKPISLLAHPPYSI